MKLSKFTTLLMILIFYLIIYYSLEVIIYYYNPDGLIYLNIYGMYYQFFIIILLIGISLNYFVGSSIIPAEYMNYNNLLSENGCNKENCKNNKLFA
jgi:hypothetical protein